MKHLTLLTLLVLAAPFGWGEEDRSVLYCEPEHYADVPALPNGAENLAGTERFMFSFGDDHSTGVLKGKGYSEPLNFQCYGYPLALVNCRTQNGVFHITFVDENFLMTGNNGFSGSAKKGTCTKF